MQIIVARPCNPLNMDRSLYRNPQRSSLYDIDVEVQAEEGLEQGSGVREAYAYDDPNTTLGFLRIH